MNTQNLSTLQVFQSLSRKGKSHFFQSYVGKKVSPFSMRTHSKSAHRKLANHKKTSSGEVSRQSLVTIAKNNKLEARKKRSVIKKK